MNYKIANEIMILTRRVEFLMKFSAVIETSQYPLIPEDSSDADALRKLEHDYADVSNFLNFEKIYQSIDAEIN